MLDLPTERSTRPVAPRVVPPLYPIIAGRGNGKMHHVLVPEDRAYAKNANMKTSDLSIPSRKDAIGQHISDYQACTAVISEAAKSTIWLPVLHHSTNTTFNFRRFPHRSSAHAVHVLQMLGVSLVRGWRRC